MDEVDEAREDDERHAAGRDPQGDGVPAHRVIIPDRVTERAPLPRLVVLGSGFGAVSLLRTLPEGTHEVTVVSPRNHFLFTPLLPSTAAGTLEFRSIVEPLRRARPEARFLLASAVSLDLDGKTVTCRGAEDGRTFAVPYDVLVVAVGAVPATYGIPGVPEHAVFLKELADARRIRERFVALLERASLPGLPEEERRRLLHVAVVGGGPTGVELAAELHDLLAEDLPRSYPEVSRLVRISLLEAAREILGGFDEALRRHAAEHFTRQGIALRLGATVAAVNERGLVLDSGEEVPAGLVVWSTGTAPHPFVASLPLAKDRAGRLLVDSFLRVPLAPGVHALGDAAQPEGPRLPQTAQVAMQQGRYLGRALGARAAGREPKPFRFVNLGMLAYIGDSEALAEIPSAGVRSHGFLTVLFWRSAYLTRLVSLKNKVLVAFDWTKALLFGRDLSKF